jgi:hypothetical protein
MWHDLQKGIITMHSLGFIVEQFDVDRCNINFRNFIPY